MDINSIIRECEQKMDKSVDYFTRELRGIRTGRATTALVDYVKVDYYGSMVDLREIAQVNVPEPTVIMIKPFDPGAKQSIIKAIEIADLGFNPMSDGAAIRINVPAPSADRRKQLVGQVRKMAEESKVAVRNERRDAIKHLDVLAKDKAAKVSEDQADGAKKQIEDMTKKHAARIDELCAKKVSEVEQL
jgi:ribosome recycling factor